MLVDFTTKYTKEPTNKSKDQVKVIMVEASISELWKIYMDGASNSRGSEVGIIIITSIKGLIEKYFYFAFQDTNNVVEYGALVLALWQ